MGRSYPPLNMLIIEDNPGDVGLFQAFFRQKGRGTRFFAVSDGEEALAFLKREGIHADAPRPDLIILDINIPKINGKDVLRQIKQDPGLKTVPTLVLTSSDNEEDVRDCYEQGANCVLSKAADVEEASRVFELIENFWVNSARLAAPPVPGPVT